MLSRRGRPRAGPGRRPGRQRIGCGALPRHRRRRTTEQRRKLAKELTEGTCRALGCTPDAVQIILTDIKKENWAEAGKLFSDT